MGSMSVAMRSSGAEGGLPNKREIAGASPAARSDSGLEALSKPSKPQIAETAFHKEGKPALSLAPEHSETAALMGKTGLRLSDPLPKPEYFTERNQENSPLVRLLTDIGDKFSKGETAGGVARAVLAAPLVVGRVASGIAEYTGVLIAVVSVPSLPIMFWSGLSLGQMAGLCIGGFAIAGAGALGGYLAEMCSHKVRGLFGDTKATWEQSLPDGKYPWRDPSSYM